MAYEILGPTFTLPASTGLEQYQAVGMSGESVAAPSVDSPIVGVIVSSGTTGSTRSGQYVTVQHSGVAIVKATASTLAAGDNVAASTAGRVVAKSTSAPYLGVIVKGSSGSAGRLVSVLLGGRSGSTA